MIAPSTRAVSVEALAALVRAGLPVREALIRWHEHAPDDVAECLKELSSRMRLGQPVPVAVGRLSGSFGQDAAGLAALIAVHGRLGGDLPRMLDELARTMHERAEATESASASVAGARLSGRLIAGLPLAFVPLTGAGGGAVFDPLGVAFLTLGVALSLGGLAWMVRLTPRPSERDDPVASAADLLACALEGGSSLPLAFSILAERAPPELVDPFSTARRKVALGLSWDAALERVDDPGLRSLGERVRHARTFGVPVADALRGFARDRRAAARIGFERAVRRSTVLMIVPLTLCVLPAFVLLGVVPFLRSLSWG